MSARSPVVLIVEDDADSREMYSLALSVMGFQPLTAATADDAFARACDSHPDAIVADVTLAGDRSTSHVGWIRQSDEKGPHHRPDRHALEVCGKRKTPAATGSCRNHVRLTLFQELQSVLEMRQTSRSDGA